MRSAVLLFGLILSAIVAVPTHSQTKDPQAIGRNVTAPQRVDVEVGWPGTVEVGNPDKLPLLVVNPFESKLQFRREYTDDVGVMRYFAFGREAGEFTLFIVGAKDNRPVVIGQIVIVVGGGKPVPPGPVPPVPPDPVPPAPVDSLLTTLQPIYAADTSETKSRDAKALAAIYKVASTELVIKGDLATIGDLYGVMKKAADNTVPLPRLNSVRDVIAAELRKQLPVQSDVPLTAELRAKCAIQFARMAGLLEAISR